MEIRYFTFYCLLHNFYHPVYLLHTNDTDPLNVLGSRLGLRYTASKDQCLALLLGLLDLIPKVILGRVLHCAAIEQPDISST